jgi:transcriptional regulator with XRE-family HTH domain
MLKNIGTKIKEAREEQNISQKDLGMSLGLTDKAISAYEACRTIPPLETLVRIAEELHKPLDYFIHNETNAFRIETQLSRMENTITEFLAEITAIRKSLNIQDPQPSTSESQPNSEAEPDVTEQRSTQDQSV